MWVIACQAFEEKIVAFLVHRTDITEHAYPQLWELSPASCMFQSSAGRPANSNPEYYGSEQADQPESKDEDVHADAKALLSSRKYP